MKKLTCILNATWMLVILLSATSIQGMEKPHNNHEEQVLLAETYNDAVCLLTSLPNEKLIDIFSHCLLDNKDHVKSLKKSIKSFMQMSMACKNFNRLLSFKIIGKLCKNYAQIDKDQALFNIKGIKNNADYKIKRLPTLILICTGADANMEIEGNYLLFRAVAYNDVELAQTLLKHHANPNVKTSFFKDPVFFYAKTIDMIQFFVKNGIDLHMTAPNETNILWKVKGEEYPSALMEFYLTHHVDATKLRPYDNDCLLHALATLTYFRQRNVEDFFKKVTLLLNAMPGMINTLNIKGKTPLDTAHETWEQSKQYIYSFGQANACEPLIALFREHGGLTAQELKELAQQAELLKPAECSLCLEEKSLAECHSMNACNSTDDIITGCKAIFCKECLLQHIAIHVNEGSTHELKCPNVHCAKKIHASDIQAITHNNKDMYQRFLDITFAEFILKNNGTIKNCPGPNCNLTYEIDINAIYRMKCPSCKNTYCSLCQYDHPGMTCQDAAQIERDCSDCATRHAKNMSCEVAARDRSQTQESLEELHNRKIKPCPNCKRFIEKNMGCNHMTCEKCRHEFCWTCLAEYGTTRCGNAGCALFNIRTGLDF